MMFSTSKVLVVVTLLIGVRRLDCFCVDCFLQIYPSATVKDIERAVVMDFKKRLMEKLGLKTEPKTRPVPPMEIINAISSSQLARDQPSPRDEVINEIKSITILPRTRSVRAKYNVYFCEFQVASDSIRNGDYEVAAVKLWLHVNKTKKDSQHRLTVFDRSWLFPVLSTDLKSSVSGWKVFKLSPSKGWLKTPWKSMHLQIKVSDQGLRGKNNTQVLSTTEGEQPYLQLLMRPVKKHRVHKRSTSTQTDDCPSDGRCCKHTMVIDVSSQMPWIIMPKNIQALVCRGTCPVLYRAHWLWSMLAQIQHGRSPCCVPTKLAPISVIHQDENLAYVQTKVNNMLVVSCGCA